MTSPAYQTLQVLKAAPTLFPAGWVYAVGQMNDKPDQFVAVIDSGGEDPDPKLRIDRPTVQVLVRGNEQGYAAAWDMALSIKKRLLGIYAPNPTLAPFPTLFSVIMRGDIAFLGYGENNRPVFTLNFRFLVEPTDTDNREPL